MTDVLVEWGRGHRAAVTTPAELDAVLDDVERQRGDFDTPYSVLIHREDDANTALQIGIGHPERAFLLRLETDGDYVVDETLVELDEELAWDYGGVATEYPPEWTRVTPAAAREAARMYVRTAQLQHT